MNIGRNKNHGIQCCNVSKKIVLTPIANMIGDEFFRAIF